METWKKNKLKKTSGFKVPEDYFETLEAKILSKIAAESQIRVMPLYKKISIAVSVAASIIFVVTLIFIPNINEDQKFNIASETIENYIVTEQINEFLITEMLTDEDLKNMKLLETFEGNELEDYLEKNIENELYFYN